MLRAVPRRWQFPSRVCAGKKKGGNIRLCGLCNRSRESSTLLLTFEGEGTILLGSVIVGVLFLEHVLFVEDIVISVLFLILFFDYFGFLVI